METYSVNLTASAFFIIQIRERKQKKKKKEQKKASWSTKQPRQFTGNLTLRRFQKPVSQPRAWLTMVSVSQPAPKLSKEPAR